MIKMAEQKITFEKSTLNSFAQMRDEMDSFRNSMNDWIIFLDGELRKTRDELAELRRKVSEVEIGGKFRF